MIDPEKWDRDDWRGFVVLVLAIGVVVVLAIVAAGTAFGDFEPKDGSSFVGVIGALVGALATYLGGRMNGQ